MPSSQLSAQLTPDGPQREPALAELLEDPIMQLLWRRDGLRMEEVAAQLDAARQQFRRARTIGMRPIPTAA